MNRIDLSGRVAIVTGGGSGLGLATAERFVASGARVTLWDRSAEALAAAESKLTNGAPVVTAVVDVSDLDAVEKAVAAVDTREGKLDIMVNSAGISGLSSPTDELDLSVWHDQLRVNLTGAFYCCLASIAPMKRNGWGRMVTVSSAAGKDGNPQQVAYSAAKAGVIGMTKSLGKELAPFNILVNCIAPTVFATPMHEVSRARLGTGLMDAIYAKIPLGRPGLPEEFAAMAAWLCSEDCSFTTGFVFDLTGGRSTY